MYVVDSKTNEGIPFAVLFGCDEYGNPDGVTGSTADASGYVSFPSAAADHWGISSLGYETKVISAYGLPSTVSLNPTTEELDTVVITANATPKAPAATPVPAPNWTPAIIVAAVFTVALAFAAYYIFKK